MNIGEKKHLSFRRKAIFTEFTNNHIHEILVYVEPMNASDLV